MSVNLGEQHGMRGTCMMPRANPWLMWSWCFAQHLQLACKSALRSKSFQDTGNAILPL